MPQKKLYSILLSILMLVSLLCGCRSAEYGNSISTHTSPFPTTANPTTEPTTTPTAMPTTVPRPTYRNPLAIPPELSDKSLETIARMVYREARLEKPEKYQLCFFGEFDDGYAILIRDTANPGEPCWETVNGLTFYYPDGCSILWLNLNQGDKIEGHLWQMFAYGRITPEQLQVIYDNYYRAYPDLLYLASGQFTFGTEEMETISQALLELTGEELTWDATNSIGSKRLVYYCTMMGMHVFRWIPPIHSAFLEYKYVNVGPCSFKLTENFQLYVYVDNELITLAEAYERGIYGDVQIETLYRYHCCAYIF